MGTHILSSILSGGDGPIDSWSGGGSSDDIKCSYGYSCQRGRRSSMEDFHQVLFVKASGKTVGLFGVFDGHGGSHVAEYVHKNLFNNLRNNPYFITETKLAIDHAYKETDDEYLKTVTNVVPELDAGSTASTAVLIEDRLFVANVGDSRAVVCRVKNGDTRTMEAVVLSTDHKPDNEKERKRIENEGGVVMWAGTWRVGGVLAVSRAFGDKNLKKYIIVKPSIKEEKITDDVKFLILASDGLWDVVSNEDAVSIVNSTSDAEDAAKKLTDEAFRKGSTDNITCIVVLFHRGDDSGKRK